MHCITFRARFVVLGGLLSDFVSSSMDGLLFRQKIKVPHAQLGIKPCNLPQCQLPTGSDIIGRLLMVRLEKMEEIGCNVKGLWLGLWVCGSVARYLGLRLGLWVCG